MKETIEQATMRALVGNASDPKQVKEARGKELRGREREVNDMRTMLSMPEGRRTLWRLMEFCSTFTSTFSESPSRTAHNSGKQDVGHFIMGEIEEARPEAFIEMMLESKKEKN